VNFKREVSSCSLHYRVVFLSLASPFSDWTMTVFNSNVALFCLAITLLNVSMRACNLDAIFFCLVIALLTFSEFSLFFCVSAVHVIHSLSSLEDQNLFKPTTS